MLPPHIRPISSLLAGIALLLLGTGLLNTLLALRGSLEGFSDQSLGLIGSAYFVGFIVGTQVCPKLIRQKGHVRAFAFQPDFTACGRARKRPAFGGFPVIRRIGPDPGARLERHGICGAWSGFAVLYRSHRHDRDAGSEFKDRGAVAAHEID